MATVNGVWLALHSIAIVTHVGAQEKIEHVGLYVRGNSNLCIELDGEAKEGTKLILANGRNDCAQWIAKRADDYKGFSDCPTAWIFCHAANEHLVISAVGDPRKGDPSVTGGQLYLRERDATTNVKWGYDPKVGRLWLPGGPGGHLPWHKPLVPIKGKYQCIDVAGQSTSQGTPIQAWDCNGLWNQNWDVNVPGCHGELDVAAEIQNATIDTVVV